VCRLSAVLTLSLTAIGAGFGVGTGATGALSTVTLSASAIGGILGGVLADRIGRARTLMLTVAVYWRTRRSTGPRLTRARRR
jgi:MFS family permease